MYLSIIIVNYNVFGRLVKCINSIKENLDISDYEIIVIDNNSKERLIDTLNNIFPEVKLLNLENNVGFGAANNYAMKCAEGKYFLLVNPDIIIKENCIQKLINFIEINSNVGIVAPALYKPDSTINYYNSFFPSMYSIIMQQFGLYNSARGMKKRMNDFFDFNLSKGEPFVVEQVMGACILTRKSIYEEIGGFDETFFLYQEETDWEYRMTKKGWKIMLLPKAKAVHDHHSSANKLGRIYVGFHGLRSIIIFTVKHFGYFKRTILRFTMMAALIAREIKYLIVFIFKPKSMFKSTYYAYKLFIFNLIPKKYLLRNKYIYKH